MAASFGTLQVQVGAIEGALVDVREIRLFTPPRVAARGDQSY